MELPVELLVAVYGEISCMSTLAILASTSKLMRSVGHLDHRLRVLRQCYLAAVRHSVDKPVRCMFSDDMSELKLELSHWAHRFALYPIIHNWHHLPVRCLTIKGDLYLLAAVKLEALLTSPNFYCEEIKFTCVAFNDDLNITNYLKQAFNACSRIRFNLCSFDPTCLAHLLISVKHSSLHSFHFTSNFTDEFPAQLFCDAISKARCLQELDISGVGLGWDPQQLTDLLSAVASTPITHLSLTHNDITSITLPSLPNIQHLDLKNNHIKSTAHKAWARLLPSCTSLALSI
ncbi:hypothetical protein DSO57_1018417 [Entomophthora muscae]|uniref:Uncharacterized protein n=2 Tax=Entomophthora muscae TaxID=34485 RepID=A0ACC2TFE7_9FUNG|nr:hypothetical protein DSO57_1018414 [Entomophthora muscae]KAJ9073257.1 hypothetical protein DSO57_1018417 [Entomophthora muscae]